MERRTCAQRQACQDRHNTHTRTHAHTHARTRSHLASCQVELNNDVVVSGGASGNGAEQIATRGALQVTNRREGGAGA